jgi:hypothetical protein
VPWVWYEFRPRSPFLWKENARLLCAEGPWKIVNVRRVGFWKLISFFSLNQRDYIWYSLKNSEVVSEYLLLPFR